ncbi:hypothetical protein [Sorangium atrum]|uniref:Uncharacterized protein n=1 Tax=Sorangium atrum TaxID=2995308 RepID=A0ABT5CA28_9BACT|nr:hypothetical protein [Sorangium aterium]MDC0683232.1 hypothetical protein [Sorangium aterium]
MGVEPDEPVHVRRETVGAVEVLQAFDELGGHLDRGRWRVRLADRGERFAQLQELLDARQHVDRLERTLASPRDPLGQLGEQASTPALGTAVSGAAAAAQEQLVEPARGPALLDRIRTSPAVLRTATPLGWTWRFGGPGRAGR